jgi:colanic acid/amylovoran biosynthesis glycosyltransferase
LKILAVAGPFPAVSETFVLDQLRGLHRAGHEVIVAAGRLPPDSEVATDLPDLPIYYRRPPPSVANVRWLGAAVTAMRVLLRRPREGWRFLGESERSRGERRFNAEALAPVLRAGDVDIVHCHFGWFGAQMAHLRTRFELPGRLVTSFHGADVSAYVCSEGTEVYEELFATGDLFLPVSHRWARRLIELGAPPERVRVHHMGVDTARFASRDGGFAAAEVLRLLSVGRLVEKKGFTDAVRAASQLRDRGVPLTYTIVGEGPEREFIEGEVRRHQLEDVVRLRGALSRSAVREELYAHDVLLAPSTTARDGDEEGIPVILMEAMATAMPVVTTRHSGIPELVEHEVGGLLAEERDVDGLAEALQRIHDDRELGERLGRNGRRRVQEDFDVHVLNDRLERQFTDLIET